MTGLLRPQSGSTNYVARAVIAKLSQKTTCCIDLPLGQLVAMMYEHNRYLLDEPKPSGPNLSQFPSPRGSLSIASYVTATIIVHRSLLTFYFRILYLLIFAARDIGTIILITTVNLDKDTLSDIVHSR